MDRDVRLAEVRRRALQLVEARRRRRTALFAGSAIGLLAIAGFAVLPGDDEHVTVGSDDGVTTTPSEPVTVRSSTTREPTTEPSTTAPAEEHAIATMPTSPPPSPTSTEATTTTLGVVGTILIQHVDAGAEQFDLVQDRYNNPDFRGCVRAEQTAPVTRVLGQECGSTLIQVVSYTWAKEPLSGDRTFWFVVTRNLPDATWHCDLPNGTSCGTGSLISAWPGSNEFIFAVTNGPTEESEMWLRTANGEEIPVH